MFWTVSFCPGSGVFGDLLSPGRRARTISVSFSGAAVNRGRWFFDHHGLALRVDRRPASARARSRCRKNSETRDGRLRLPRGPQAVEAMKAIGQRRSARFCCKVGPVRLVEVSSDCSSRVVITDSVSASASGHLAAEVVSSLQGRRAQRGWTELAGQPPSGEQLEQRQHSLPVG